MLRRVTLEKQPRCFHDGPLKTTSKTQLNYRDLSDTWLRLRIYSSSTVWFGFGQRKKRVTQIADRCPTCMQEIIAWGCAVGAVRSIFKCCLKIAAGAAFTLRCYRFSCGVQHDFSERFCWSTRIETRLHPHLAVIIVSSFSYEPLTAFMFAVVMVFEWFDAELWNEWDARNAAPSWCEAVEEWKWGWFNSTFAAQPSLNVFPLTLVL